MKIDIRAWAEGVGVVAVVLSLLFVGFEIRQSSEIATVEASQALAQMSQELTVTTHMEPEFASLIIKADEQGLDSLDAIERERYVTFVRLSFNVWEQAFYSHSRGVLTDEHWQNWNSANCDRIPARWFETLDRIGFLPEFVELVDECYAKAKEQEEAGGRPP